MRRLFILALLLVFSSSSAASAGLVIKSSHVPSMVDLGTLGGTSSSARAVSSDGSVVVGSAKNVSAQDRAFRWW